MNAYIVQVTAKIKKGEEGSLEGVKATGVNGKIEAASPPEFLFVCGSHQSLSSSHATVTDGDVTSQIYHHVTCKDLGFQKKEVTITHVDTRNEISRYKIKVL